MKNLNGTMFLGVLVLMDATRENIQKQKKGGFHSTLDAPTSYEKITFQDVIVTFALYKHPFHIKNLCSMLCHIDRFARNIVAFKPRYREKYFFRVRVVPLN